MSRLRRAQIPDSRRGGWRRPRTLRLPRSPTPSAPASTGATRGTSRTCSSRLRSRHGCAESLVGEDGTRAEALRDAGVDRLLSPEELVRKTEAITGYVWGRSFSLPFGTGEARSRLRDPQAFSRKWGFSGRLLSQGCDRLGIVYTSIRALGGDSSQRAGLDGR